MKTLFTLTLDYHLVSSKKAKSFKSLATRQDIRELKMLYHEYFQHDGDDDDDEPIITESESLINLNDVEGGDLGVEEESSMPPDTLAYRLGFVRQSLPHQFNTERHPSGVSLWQESSWKSAKQLEKVKLHWHQLAGVHSVIRNSFSSKEDSDDASLSGMLISDEVGLGKTALAITVIAFLNQVLSLMAKGERLPPILGKIVFCLTFLVSFLVRQTAVTRGPTASSPTPSHSRSWDLARAVDP